MSYFSKSLSLIFSVSILYLLLSWQNSNVVSIKTTNVVIKFSGAKKFLDQNPSYNQDIMFLIDMKIASGSNRFFVVDVKNKKIIDKGLVAHGFGKDGSVKFSNVPESNMSSLGKYKIGKSYSGKYGKSYKLFGLDSSNSNADVRSIVIHSYDEVPNMETTNKIVCSLGCPMVNKIFFGRLEKILDKSEKPILLEMYN